MMEGIEKTTMGLWTLLARGILNIPTNNEEKNVDVIMVKDRLRKVNFINPARKPRDNTVKITFLGMLNNIPKPRAAIPAESDFINIEI